MSTKQDGGRQLMGEIILGFSLKTAFLLVLRLIELRSCFMWVLSSTGTFAVSIRSTGCFECQKFPIVCKPK